MTPRKLMFNVKAGWVLLHAGLTLRVAQGSGDLGLIAGLRDRCFAASGSDEFDAKSLHLMVLDHQSGALRATCRLRLHDTWASASRGYTGQFYDLAVLDRAAVPGPLVELGRVCTAPDGVGQTAALRLIWAGITDLVQGHGHEQGQGHSHGARVIFGCASFAGADRLCHLDALRRLAGGHRHPDGDLAKARVEPLRTIALADLAATHSSAPLPALLRSYLALGAWVGPDAVLDPDLDTLHVLTVLAVDRIAPARRAALNAFLAACGGMES